MMITNKNQDSTMPKSFTAFIEYDPETKMYVGIIPGISGAHSQADSMDELNINLKEVLELCLEELDDDIHLLPKYIGTQNIEVA